MAISNPSSSTTLTSTDITTAIGPTIRNASPNSGQTVSSLATDKDQVINITPAGALASLTVTLPADAVSRTGQQVVMSFRQAVAALTTSGPATILNGATAVNAGDVICYVKVAADTWVRVSNVQYRTGLAQPTGNSITTAFSFAHGLGASPAHATVSSKTALGTGDSSVTWDATNITVTYLVAPSAGTLQLSWFATL